MKLHTNVEVFRSKLELISQKSNVPLSIVERDYWLTDILYNFSCHKLSNKLVVKGGCALKYFYGLIDREVYDVDFVSIEPVMTKDIRFMFDDIMYASHFSTDEEHVLQHVRWYPYDHENLSQEIRMDYYKGETVFEYCDKNYIGKCMSEIFKDTLLCDEYLIKDFSLTVMGINNIFVEKVLAFSDKYIRERYSEAEKHFSDVLVIFTSGMLEEEKVKDLFCKKIEHDIQLFGNEKIERMLEFEVFLDDKFMDKYNKDKKVIEELVEFLRNVI